jgi:hypothetical protein
MKGVAMERKLAFDRVRNENKDLNLGSGRECFRLANAHLQNVLHLVRLAPLLYRYTGLWRHRKGIHVMLSLATVRRILTGERTEREQVDLINAAIIGATFEQEHHLIQQLLPRCEHNAAKESAWSPTAIRVCVSIFATAEEEPLCARAIFAANLGVDLTDTDTLLKFARICSPDDVKPEKDVLELMQQMLLDFLEAGGNPRDLADLCDKERAKKINEKITQHYHRCATCHSAAGITLKVCGRCKKVWYCSTACQAKDWKTHKSVCVKIDV